MPPLYQVAACWTVGFLATNMSFGIAKKGSVSFTHAVKVLFCIAFGEFSVV
jgi:hypothetical protein